MHAVYMKVPLISETEGGVRGPWRIRSGFRRPFPACERTAHFQEMSLRACASPVPKRLRAIHLRGPTRPVAHIPPRWCTEGAARPLTHCPCSSPSSRFAFPFLPFGLSHPRFPDTVHPVMSFLLSAAGRARVVGSGLPPWREGGRNAGWREVRRTRTGPFMVLLVEVRQRSLRARRSLTRDGGKLPVGRWDEASQVRSSGSPPRQTQAPDFVRIPVARCNPHPLPPSFRPSDVVSSD